MYRWRERKPAGGYAKRTELIGPVSVLKTETNARRAVEHRRLEINSEDPKRETVTMNAVISRYLEEELPELRHSTADAYRSYLTNHIKPRWGDQPVRKIKPFGVEQWLKQLDLAPKTKGQDRRRLCSDGFADPKVFILPRTRRSSQPLRIMEGSIKVVGRLVELEVSLCGSGRGSRQ